MAQLKVGPLFSDDGKYIYLKLSEIDKHRAIIDRATMTLTEYVERDSITFPSEMELRSDKSLFVPIFCVDCYGTTQENYDAFLESVLAGADDTDEFIVGVCCVFGDDGFEPNPGSRAKYKVTNELAYSAACQMQPGKAFFMHDTRYELGDVLCYWHVHSRNSEKTFLYCCVKCHHNEYTNTVMKYMKETCFELSYSLGTRGENSLGPITDECSFVTVPMRAGCFCEVHKNDSLLHNLRSRGFSTVKEGALEAGMLSPLVSSENSISPLSSELEHCEPKLAALSNLLSGLMAQVHILTQRIDDPCHLETQYNRYGAEDYYKRTGNRPKLCAGVLQKTDSSAAVTERSYTAPMEIHDVDSAIKLLNNYKQQQQEQQQQQQQQQLESQSGSLNAMGKQQQQLQTAPFQPLSFAPQLPFQQLHGSGTPPMFSQQIPLHLTNAAQTQLHTVNLPPYQQQPCQTVASHPSCYPLQYSNVLSYPFFHYPQPPILQQDPGRVQYNQNERSERSQAISKKEQRDVMMNEMFSQEERELIKEMEDYKAQKEAEAKQAEQHEMLSKVVKRVIDELRPSDTETDTFEDISKGQPYKRRKKNCQVDTLPESELVEQSPSTSSLSGSGVPLAAAEEPCTTPAVGTVLTAGYQAPKDQTPNTRDGQIWEFVQDVVYKVPRAPP